jgi:hypothetical protein
MAGVVRSFREGEITVDVDGTRHRAVVTLEWSFVTGRWWTARRRIGTNPVQIGVFHGEWEEREGEGLDALDEALRPWVDDHGVELLETAQTGFTPKAQVPLEYGSTTLNRLPPPEPAVYADIIANMRDQALKTEAPYPFEIYGFKGVEMEWFVLSDAPPVPLDDLVRAIAARGPADVVAVRYLGVAELDGESHRAVFCAVECAGRRLDRVLALKHGPDGAIVAWQALYQDRGPVGPEGCWLGVAPARDVDVFALGPGGQRYDA